jgi:hypothetical protein
MTREIRVRSIAARASMDMTLSAWPQKVGKSSQLCQSRKKSSALAAYVF